MITNLKSHEATILNPIRLQVVKPVTELSFVPPQLRHRTELAVTDESMRLSAIDTQKLMEDMRRSVAHSKDEVTGLTQFGGTMRHPDLGSVQVRGRGAIHKNEFRAEGSLEFVRLSEETNFPQRLIFLIEKFSMKEGEVDQIMRTYEATIAGADIRVIHEITKQFSEVFAVVAKELEDEGKLVMYVSAPGEVVDVRGEVAKIEKANIAFRIISKMVFKVDMARGNRIGEYGARIGRQETKSGQIPKVRALLTA